MPLTREQLRSQLRKREIAPVYVLYGAETYLRDIAAKTIADLSFAAGEFRDFNDDEFSLNTPDNIRTALAAADQLPMMASRRVVRITEVRVAATSNKDTLKEDQFDALAAYLSNPSPSSVVIFVADELNRNRKVGKLLTDKSVAVEFAPLDDQESFLAAARRADLNQLKKAVIALADTDLAIKTSIGGSAPKGSRMQLEMLVCELAAS